MTAISTSTQKRLQKLPQIPSVWEGDRRHVDQVVEEFEEESGEERELIVWVDGVEGVVRSMEIVNHSMGSEAIVRALLKAMESPQSPAQPARPQKIIVRDRQIQFYLRGVLQDLGIAIDYVPQLPIVDELFERFNQMAHNRPPKLPPEYDTALRSVSKDIWQLAPWDILADRDILSVTLNGWDVETLYVSVMGMLGMEYGILLYRSAESLQRFRASALARHTQEAADLEAAFLAQDCIFLTFDANESDNLPLKVLGKTAALVEANFGNIHPMEGMRPFLYAEEALATYISLVALKKFIEAHRQQLDVEELPSLSKRYKVDIPGENRQVNITVATCPDLCAELLQMQIDLIGEDDDDDDFDAEEVPLREDLIPDNSFISLGVMPWDRVELIRQMPTVHHQPSQVKSSAKGDGLPLVLIQTTRPKAKEIIDRIVKAGGLKGICFNPAENPLESEIDYDLGILQLGDGEMQLFCEFESNAIHTAARQKWDTRAKATKGYCGLAIAHGVTGKSKGQPGLREMVALFETRSLSEEELGLGILHLM
jgi:hypothetical protein